LLYLTFFAAFRLTWAEMKSRSLTVHAQELLADDSGGHAKRAGAKARPKAPDAEERCEKNEHAKDDLFHKSPSFSAWRSVTQ
jgi:hypothetical protein